MNLEPGDVVLIRFPFSDVSGSKTRPAIVVSATTLNREGHDVFLCPITSNISAGRRGPLLRPQDMDAGRLLAVSRARVDKVMALNQKVVHRRIGRLKTSVLRTIVGEIVRLLAT